MRRACVRPRFLSFPVLLGIAFLAIAILASGHATARSPAAADDSTGEDWIATDAFGDVAARAGWRPVTNWVFDPGAEDPRVVPGTGAILDATGDAGDLFTLVPHRDLEVSGEFQLDDGAETTLRFLGRYAILLAASDGGGTPTLDHPGTIIGATADSGIPPRIALPCAPRTWHRFSATVRAPRFDARGVKVAPARVMRVLVDGVLLQVGVDLPSPSLGAPEFEVPEAPFALSSDGGGVAFRALRGRVLTLDTPAGPKPAPRSARAVDPDAPPLRKVVVFSRTAGFRHGSIPVATRAIEALGDRHGFRVFSTEDPETMLIELADSDIVLFLNTTGDVLDDAQQARFEARIGPDLGFVGVHAAADTEYEWPFYGALVGAYFKSHPAIQEARVRVVDADHPATAMLPEVWTRTDEWYDFRALPPEGTRILAALEPDSYEGSTMRDEHPIAWCSTLDSGARSIYLGGGHTDASFAEPLFLAHLLGAMRWAAGDDTVDATLTDPLPAPAGGTAAGAGDATAESADEGAPSDETPPANDTDQDPEKDEDTENDPPHDEEGHDHE